MTAPTDKAAIERHLNTGLLDTWHPVLPSWALGSEAVGLTRLARQIVIWRDGAGRVHALEDRCPHRGARLALGWNLGDRLACWYHGVQVRADGAIADVPAVADCPMTTKARVRAYPAREHAGAVFVYFGLDPAAPPVPLDLPEPLTSDAFGHRLCVAHWKCNYRYAIDNVMDPMHGSYLHAASHSMAEGDKSAEMRLRTTPRGFVFEKTTQRDVNFDWVEFGESGCLWLTLEIPYQKRHGPGGPFGIVGFATPVDEANTLVFFWRTRKVQGWQRDVWRFLYGNRLEGLHWEVLEQDRQMLENLAPGAREREFLYQHDVGLARVRRHLLARAAAEVAALAEAAK